MLKKREIKELLDRESNVCKGKKIYNVDGDLYKLYAKEFSYFYGFSYDFFCEMVDVEQIKWLYDLRKFIKLTHLPRGIISCKKEAVGVLYDYFDGYLSFEKLPNEDKELIFQNLRSAIEKNRELITYDVYNTDLISQNILYKGTDVEFIDLDGRYVKNDYRFEGKVNNAFLHSIYEILLAKIEKQYSKEDLKILKKELYKIMGLGSTLIFDFPYDVIDRVEKEKIIK